MERPSSIVLKLLIISSDMLSVSMTRFNAMVDMISRNSTGAKAGKHAS